MMEEFGTVTAKSQIQKAFHSSASSGDVQRVARLIDSIVDVDEADSHGWTALMLAARNGHHQVVKLLLDKGCNCSCTNKAGQTALEIAEFWNYPLVTDLLTTSPSSSPAGPYNVVNFFGLSLLDRSSHRRTDDSWLQSRIHDTNGNTTFLLFSKSSPYIRWSSKGLCEICRFGYDQVKFLLDGSEGDGRSSVIIFLGVGELSPVENSPTKHDSTSSAVRAWFAIGVDQDVTPETIKSIQPDAELLSPKGFLALLALSDREAGIVGQAKALFNWHDRYKFCPTCGSSMRVEEAGYKRRCENQECRSLKGVHNTSYPRVDPVGIMAVIHPDGNQLLLGRKPQFPRNMYSCLAGFMEPGETIEDAVRREVHEESGIKVGRVAYHSSQPWPMPSQLMIGCLAYALTTEITVDTKELEDAKWFDRQTVMAALQAGVDPGGAGTGVEQQPQLFVPFRQAIAHQLIKAWVGMTANL